MLKCKDILFCLILSTLFIDNVFINVGFSLKPYMLFVIAFIIIDFNGQIVRFKAEFKSGNTLLIILLLCFYSLLSSFWAVSQEQNIKLSLAYIISNIVFIIIYCNYDKVYENISTIIKITMLFFITGVIFHFLNFTFSSPESIRSALIQAQINGTRTELGNSMASFSYVGDDFIPRFNGFSLDPNFFTLSVIYLFLLLFLSNIKNIYSIFFCVFLLLLAFSRSGIFALIVSILIVVIRDFIFFRTIKKTNFIIISSFIFLAIFFLILYPHYFELILNKFEGSLNSKGDIRSQYVWPMYLSLIEQPFGYGWNYGKDLVGLLTHNTYLAFFVGLGAFGILGFIIIIIKVFVANLSRSSSNILIVVFWFTIVIFTIDAQFNAVFWSIIALLLKYKNMYRDLKC